MSELGSLAKEGIIDASVSLWEHNVTKEQRAVKKLRKKNMIDRKKFQIEIKFMKEIDHPHIMNIIET